MFADDDARRALLVHADKTFAALLPVFAGLGLVPLLGLAAALVLYRVSPASSLAALVSWKQRLLGRVLRFAAVTVLVLLQPIPGVGVVAVPAMLVITHLASRIPLLRLPRRTPAPSLAA
ncbi:MAG: hypothetical protein ACK4N5_26930 [Myxococcales bacterium]